MTDPTIAAIQEVVAEWFCISLIEMRSDRRARRVARPRQIAMFLARELTTQSLPAIGRRFQRDHTTVMHAINKVQQLIAVNRDIAATIDAIRQALCRVANDNLAA